MATSLNINGLISPPKVQGKNLVSYTCDVCHIQVQNLGRHQKSDKHILNVQKEILAEDQRLWESLTSTSIKLRTRLSSPLSFEQKGVCSKLDKGLNQTWSYSHSEYEEATIQGFKHLEDTFAAIGDKFPNSDALSEIQLPSDDENTSSVCSTPPPLDLSTKNRHLDQDESLLCHVKIKDMFVGDEVLKCELCDRRFRKPRDF